MAGRKLDDPTFYVARRLGRTLAQYQLVPEACQQVAVLLDGGWGSALLLYLMKARRLWVPHRPELLALLPEAPAPSGLEVPGPLLAEPLGSACRNLCRVWEVPALVVPPGPLLQHAVAARQAGAQSLLLGDCLEDRAAAVFGSILLDGRLDSLPLGEDLGGLKVGRPLGAVMYQRLREAGAESPIGPEFHDDLRRQADPRQVLLEDFLSFLPGDRLDLLTNLAGSPDRVHDGYLT
jgi:hypothetical protein